MTTAQPTHQLNAKAIKKALKNEGIKVVSCKACTGSVSKAIYIVVSTKDAEKAAVFFKNAGIVGSRGSELKARKTRYDDYEFGYCYMSNEMYNELNN